MGRNIRRRWKNEGSWKEKGKRMIDGSHGGREKTRRRKRAKRRSGGVERTVLISFQKHAIINFFARDRLDRVLGRHTQETAAVENGRKRRLPQMPCPAAPAFTFYSPTFSLCPSSTRSCFVM